MLVGIDSLSQKLAIQSSCSFSLLHSFQSCFLIIIIFFKHLFFLFFVAVAAMCYSMDGVFFAFLLIGICSGFALI